MTGPPSSAAVWVDAQLPPALARWLRQTHAVDAWHVEDVQQLVTDDPAIFAGRAGRAAVVVTKDEDFVELVERLGPPPQGVLAFVCAIQVWDGDVLDVPSPRAHSTEPRRLAIGCIGETVIAVAFVLIDNDETRHIISSRHASRQERRRYAIHTA